MVTIIIHSSFCQSKDVNINCKFAFENLSSKNISTCKIEENIKIESENTIISIKNAHENRNIKGFLAKHKQIFYMPRNIGNLFKFIEYLEINNCSLRKITSENLNEFKNLKYLSLANNKIEHLKSGLFQNNPQLTTVNLNYNQISWIEPTVLGSKSAITIFALDGNVCYSDTAIDKSGVDKMIEIIKTACNVNVYKFHRLESKCMQQEHDLTNLLNNESKALKQAQKQITKLHEIIDELKGSQKLTKALNNETEMFEISKMSQVRPSLDKVNLELKIHHEDPKYLKMSLIATAIVSYFCNFLLIYFLFPNNEDEEESNTNKNSKFSSVFYKNKKKTMTSSVHNSLYEEVK